MQGKKVIIYLFLLVGLTFTGFGQQNSKKAPKIAYTNVEYILVNLPGYKSVQSKLKSHEQQLRKQLQQKVQNFQQKYKEFEQGKGTMIDEIKQDKQKELQEMQQSIREFQQTSQESLQKKESELLDPLLTKIDSAIKTVAEREGYSYVLSSHTINQASPIILYAKEKENNISDKVLKELGVENPTRQSEEIKGVKDPTPGPSSGQGKKGISPSPSPSQGGKKNNMGGY